MGMIDVRCQDGITSSTDYCCAYKQKGFLLLGHNYQVYLFFNLPPCLCSKNLIQAKLILFKLRPSPFIAKEFCADNRYNLYPLLDFYSAFSCMFSPPVIDCSRRIIFENDYCRCYTEADVTHIVKDWADDKIENFGIFLTGNSDSGYIYYAPGGYDIIGMRPLLRLTYKDMEICQPLNVVPCGVKVNN